MEKCSRRSRTRCPSWVKNWGQAEVCFTSLGTGKFHWTDKRFLDSVEGGIRWTLGLAEGDATPNPEVSAAEEAKAKKAAGG